MPDKVIDIPGVGQIAFPDSMSDAQINAAATKLYQQKNPASKQPPVKSWIDTAVDWLPTVGGAVGGIVGGIGGTVGGMGVGGVPGAVGGAALGGAVGEAARQLITEARGGPVPTMGEAATGLAKQAAVQGGAELAGAGVGAAMSHVAPRMMQSALKPTLGVLRDVAKGAPVPRVVQTLLDEGVNVTPAGLGKLTTLLNATKAERDVLIDDAIKRGAPGVNPFSVTARLGETAQKFGQQVNPAPDLEAIGEAGNAFLKEFGGNPLALDHANQIKEGTYAVLRKKYGQLGSASVESQKALARGLKEEIEQQVPGVDAVNRRLGNLSDAERAVGRRVAIASNRDMGGLVWLAENPTTALAFVMDRHPAVKSMLARGLYQSAGAAARVSPQLLRGLVALAAQGDDDALAPASGGSSSDPGRQ